MNEKDRKSLRKRADLNKYLVNQYNTNQNAMRSHVEGGIKWCAANKYSDMGTILQAEWWFLMARVLQEQDNNCWVAIEAQAKTLTQATYGTYRVDPTKFTERWNKVSEVCWKRQCKAAAMLLWLGIVRLEMRYNDAVDLEFE